MNRPWRGLKFGEQFMFTKNLSEGVKTFKQADYDGFGLIVFQYWNNFDQQKKQPIIEVIKPPIKIQKEEKHMSFDQKKILNSALTLAVTIAESTANPIDDIVVKAAVSILRRVFSLGE